MSFSGISTSRRWDKRLRRVAAGVFVAMYMPADVAIVIDPGGRVLCRSSSEVGEDVAVPPVIKPTLLPPAGLTFIASCLNWPLAFMLVDPIRNVQPVNMDLCSPWSRSCRRDSSKVCKRGCLTGHWRPAAR